MVSLEGEDPLAPLALVRTRAAHEESLGEQMEQEEEPQSNQTQDPQTSSTSRGQVKRQQQRRIQLANPDQEPQTHASKLLETPPTGRQLDEPADMDDDDEDDDREHQGQRSRREDEQDQEMDEEQVRRMLACKRLSEGNCNFHLARQLGGHLGASRKNSLHLFAGASESLPPVTEGEPMRHMSHHLSQNMDGSQSSGSASSSSLRLSASANMTSNQRLMMMMMNGNGGRRPSSQDDNTTSCSSSNSLDGSNGLRSPTRRRSSTVSQCSSVLSEGTRQQLNFDLSPDLAPDSSILEANALSPGPFDFERPTSPEPSSLGSTENSLDMLRSMSRMSQQPGDELMLASSPDSLLGPSYPACRALEEARLVELEREDGQGYAREEAAARRPSETTSAPSSQEHETSVRDNLERLISNVSAVKVSSGCDAAAQQPTGQPNSQDWCQQTIPAPAGRKRAHTPFGLNIQRSKTSHTCPATPSPTAGQTANIPR